MKIQRCRADDVFSKYIRTRDKWRCQKCGAQHQPGSQGLHAAHHFGRARESVRFDPDNVDSLCMGCHMYFHGNPKAYVDWKMKKLGPSRYLLLEVAANEYKKKDRKMALIKAKALLEALK